MNCDDFYWAKKSGSGPGKRPVAAGSLEAAEPGISNPIAHKRAGFIVKNLNFNTKFDIKEFGYPRFGKTQ